MRASSHRDGDTQASEGTDRAPGMAAVWDGVCPHRPGQRPGGSPSAVALADTACTLLRRSRPGRLVWRVGSWPGVHRPLLVRNPDLGDSTSWDLDSQLE